MIKHGMKNWGVAILGVSILFGAATFIWHRSDLKQAQSAARPRSGSDLFKQAQAGDPETRRALLAQVTSPDLKHERIAARALGYYPDSEATQELLRVLMLSDDLMSRSLFASILSSWSSERENVVRNVATDRKVAPGRRLMLWVALSDRGATPQLREKARLSAYGLIREAKPEQVPALLQELFELTPKWGKMDSWLSDEISSAAMNAKADHQIRVAAIHAMKSACPKGRETILERLLKSEHDGQVLQAAIEEAALSSSRDMAALVRAAKTRTVQPAVPEAVVTRTLAALSAPKRVDPCAVIARSP